MTRIGWHFQGGVPGWAQGIVNAEWNKVIDPPGNDPLPGRKTIGRTYVDDNISNQMVMQGARGADAWFTLHRGAYERAPWVYCWEGPNEPPVQTPEQRRALSAFTIRYGELMHGIGRRIVGLLLSVGWTDIGQAADLGPCLASCDFIGLHEYSAPTMQSEAGWYCLRYRRTVAEWQQAGYTVPPILITECGIDGGVCGRPRTGWKSYCTGVEYTEQLRWYLSETRKDPLVQGMTVFTSTPIGWGDFEVDEQLSRQIAAVNAAQPEPEPQPEPGGNMQTGSWIDDLNIKIIPYEQRPDAAAWTGGPIYRAIMAFNTRDGSWEPSDKPGSVDQWAVDAFASGSKIDGAGGDHNLFVVVFDKDGKPISGKGLLYWQGELKSSPQSMTWVTRNAKPDGSENIPIFGSYAPDRGESGSWGATTVGRSDALMGAGMPYNAHVSTFLVLQATEGTTPEPQPEPGTGDLKETNAILRDILAVLTKVYRV